MATLEQIFQNLEQQLKDGECRKAKNGDCYADRILRIPGLKNLTVKATASSNGRFYITIYRGSNVTKSFAIYADDADDFEIISAFLKKYATTINKYVTRRGKNGSSTKEAEVDLDENQNESKSEEQENEEQKEESSTKKKSKVKRINIEDKF
jgi:hypothetical protein